MFEFNEFFFLIEIEILFFFFEEKMSGTFINLNEVEQQRPEDGDLDVDDDNMETAQQQQQISLSSLSLSIAGLNIDEIVEYIQCDQSIIWNIIDDLGSIYQWRYRNQRFRKVNNMNGRSHILLRPIISEQLWNEFKLRMYENRFILITLTGGKKSHIMLYYCHRRVMNVLPGQNLLIFGPVSICFNDFIDINCESIFELERMRHIHLHGRGFKFRVQSNSHKLFLYPTDIIDGKINFKWIQQLPPPTPTPTPTIDNQSAADNQNQQQQQNNNIHNDNESTLMNDHSIPIINEDSL